MFSVLLFVVLSVFGITPT